MYISQTNCLQYPSYLITDTAVSPNLEIDPLTPPSVSE